MKIIIEINRNPFRITISKKKSTEFTKEKRPKESCMEFISIDGDYFMIK